MMSAAFDRQSLLVAFDEIGHAALRAGTRLEIVVYGGSALMLAGNFRWATEDVDIAAIEKPWPNWLTEIVAEISSRNGWLANWFNDGVSTFLSPLASRAEHHGLFGTFPRDEPEHVGLIVHVPKPDYLFALKLKASRVNNSKKWTQESTDIANLAKAIGVKDIDAGIAILARYFPVSAREADKERFVLKHVLGKTSHDDPDYTA
jgi:hypothetical protein